MQIGEQQQNWNSVIEDGINSRWFPRIQVEDDNWITFSYTEPQLQKQIFRFLNENLEEIKHNYLIRSICSPNQPFQLNIPSYHTETICALKVTLQHQKKHQTSPKS